jgi:AcrR family transcriptional regulator
MRSCVAAAEPLGPADPLARAVVTLVRECGYEAPGLEDFANRAGLSAAEVSRRYVDKRTLTSAVLDGAIADFKEGVGAAYMSRDCWPDNLRAAGWATAAWIGTYPDEVWFAMVGVLGAGDMVLARRESLFLWFVTLVDAGREVAPDPSVVAPSAALQVIGSVVETVRRYTEGSLVGDAFITVPRLMYGAVRPYLGEEAARRELSIGPPAGWPG